MKENKGITLVALIITIIVMLILVGVTISALVQSDIIGQGEEAARAYENKQTEEQNLNFATEDSKTVQNYLDEVQTKESAKGWYGESEVYDAGDNMIYRLAFFPEFDKKNNKSRLYFYQNCAGEEYSCYIDFNLEDKKVNIASAPLTDLETVVNAMGGNMNDLKNSTYIPYLISGTIYLYHFTDEDRWFSDVAGGELEYKEIDMNNFPNAINENV